MQRAEIITILREGGRLISVRYGDLTRWYVQLPDGAKLRMENALPIAGVIRDLRPAVRQENNRTVYTLEQEPMTRQEILDAIHAGGVLCRHQKPKRPGSPWWCERPGRETGFGINSSTARSIIQQWPGGLFYEKTADNVERWHRHPENGAGRKLAPGICRVCGCTENNACVVTTQLSYGPPMITGCSWVDGTKTLCNNASCLAYAKTQSWFRPVAASPQEG